MGGGFNMTITAIGQLLGDIIQGYMQLPQRYDEQGNPTDSVVLKDENWDAPKDNGLYVLIEYEDDTPVGVGSDVDSTGLETSHYNAFANFTIEVISRNRDATDRYPEVLMALQSVAGQQAAELHNVAFFRGKPLNLSAIEGSASLRRWHIPVIVSYMQTKTATAPLIAPDPVKEIKVEA
jgi:hypothetical protein